MGSRGRNGILDCVVHDRDIQVRTVLQLKDVVLCLITTKSAVETGTPFIFNGIMVNRANPSSATGVS